jgi:hypothetical protein
MIKRNVVRVGRKQAMDHLKLKLNGYRHSWKRVYIGATTDPQSRWKKHASHGWDKMVVLYEAFSPQIVRDLERDLIDYAQHCNFQLEIENIAAGGEGIRDQPRTSYLYVLVRGKRSRRTFFPQSRPRY